MGGWNASISSGISWILSNVQVGVVKALLESYLGVGSVIGFEECIC